MVSQAKFDALYQGWINSLKAKAEIEDKLKSVPEGM
jgi:hypothetical protein